MTRVRRVRWIVGAALVATAVTTLSVGARAMAQEGDSTRCAAPQAAGPVRHDPSWRSGALRAMGCHAWHRVHTNHRTLVRVSR